MRDRLIEILEESDDLPICDSYDGFADYLIENGVIVPPVKIGQELWDIHYNRPRKWEVVYLGFNGKEWFINLHYYKDKHNFATRQIQDRYLNRLFFYSREEAEKALVNYGSSKTEKGGK